MHFNNTASEIRPIKLHHFGLDQSGSRSGAIELSGKEACFLSWGLLRLAVRRGILPHQYWTNPRFLGGTGAELPRPVLWLASDLQAVVVAGRIRGFSASNLLCSLSSSFKREFHYKL